MAGKRAVIRISDRHLQDLIHGAKIDVEIQPDTEECWIELDPASKLRPIFAEILAEALKAGARRVMNIHKA